MPKRNRDSYSICESCQVIRSVSWFHHNLLNHYKIESLLFFAGEHVHRHIAMHMMTKAVYTTVQVESVLWSTSFHNRKQLNNSFYQNQLSFFSNETISTVCHAMEVFFE